MIDPFQVIEALAANVATLNAAIAGTLQPFFDGRALSYSLSQRLLLYPY